MVMKGKVVCVDEDEQPVSDVYDISCHPHHNFFVYSTPTSYGVLVSNCHHYASDALFRLAMKCSSRFRFGLTATPFRSDNSDLKFYGALGDQIPGITASELIDKGYLVPPKITFIKIPKVSLPIKATNWHSVYSKCVVDNTLRNNVIVNVTGKLAKEGRHTLVLVTQIRHGQILQKMMKKEDINCVFVHASVTERPDIVKKFKKGDIPVLISSPIFDEGVDLPICSAIVLAGAGKSPTKAVQRVGRGLRTHPESEKKDVKIVEFFDQSKYLKKHAKDRLKIYQTEPRFEISGEIE